MAEQTYWSKTLGQRPSRRSLFRTGGIVGAGVAGAALIGCGDDDEAGTPETGTATPTTTPEPVGEDANGDRQGGRLE